jgi:methylated-DNA-[protein]-cysteine S-methyltransferase
MTTTEPTLLQLLPMPDTTTTDRLHRRLEDAAATAGLLDVAYRMIDSPIGPLLLATTEAGMVRVAFEREGIDAVLDELAREVSPRVLRAPRRLDTAARELDEYLEGRRRTFDLPLDLRLSHGFRRTVLTHLADIGYGHTASYGEVARASGNPRAARAVGSACRTNPLPLIVPCHRVVRSDGTIGEYLGGVEAKRLLLQMEASA